MNDSIINYLAERHNLDVREVGTRTREYSGLLTSELKNSLQEFGISFDVSKANNKNHPDYGKLCLSFSWIRSAVNK